MNSAGKTVDFLLRAKRDVAAAKAFFQQAFESQRRLPRAITLEGYQASRRVAREFLSTHRRDKRTKLRSSKYLNNLIEQDHRSIKLRLGPMLGFKRFRHASIMIAGIELMHRIRKGQLALGKLRGWIKPHQRCGPRCLLPDRPMNALRPVSYPSMKFSPQRRRAREVPAGAEGGTFYINLLGADLGALLQSRTDMRRFPAPLTKLITIFLAAIVDGAVVISSVNAQAEERWARAGPVERNIGIEFVVCKDFVEEVICLALSCSSGGFELISIRSGSGAFTGAVQVSASGRKFEVQFSEVDETIMDVVGASGSRARVSANLVEAILNARHVTIRDPSPNGISETYATTGLESLLRDPKGGCLSIKR